MQILNLIIITISSLISVAFFTLMERKTLGYIQIRKGPNKVSFLGILQPISDALKLLSKSILSSEHMNIKMSIFSPISTFFLSLTIWPLIPCFYYGIFDSKFSILSFFVISSISVYSLLMIGWSANSKYSHLGSIRSVAQMISYEVSLFISIISLCFLCHSYKFFSLYKLQDNFPFLFILLPIFLIWMISSIAETNRSPFDFAEGESELVSGFNVEYLGGPFALIFLAEYLNILMLSIISSVFFFFINLYILMLFSIFISFSFLWIRGTFPRFRYDLLMELSWKIILPISISLNLPFLSLSFLSF